VTAALAAWVGRVVVVLVAAAVVDLALPSGSLRRYVDVVVGLVVLVTVLQPVLDWLGADLQADIAAAEVWLEQGLTGTPGAELRGPGEARWRQAVREEFAGRVAAAVRQGLARDLGIQAEVAVELAADPASGAGAGWDPPPLERVVVRVTGAAAGDARTGSGTAAISAAGPAPVQVEPIRVRVPAAAGTPGEAPGQDPAPVPAAVQPGEGTEGGAATAGGASAADRIRAWVAGVLGIDPGQVTVTAEEVGP